MTQTDLAITHLHGRDPEQAAALDRDALRTAAQVDSTIILERLRTLQRQVRPLRSAFPTCSTSTTDDRLPHPHHPHHPPAARRQLPLM